jgi:outer membrane protein assembly factor BamE (lipoprotein component of BamABCDE complex)
MNSRLFEAIGALALASTISACASFSQAAATEPEYERLAQVHAGLSSDDVLRIAGKPGTRTGAAKSGEVWIYNTRDAWGEDTEYDVTFNSSGVVASVTPVRERG